MQMLGQEIILTQAVEAMNNSYPKTILVAEDNEESRVMLRKTRRRIFGVYSEAF
jgi:hypothetical protein